MGSYDPLVSVVIVHYNNIDYLHNCIASISESTYKKLELIIVDNGSPKIRLSDLPKINMEVRHILSPRNMGFGDGCNQGICNAKGHFVFLLNNDIEIESNCISELVKASIQDHSIVVAQPKMLDLRDTRHFHSSGAGGMIDIFGYPFARGRIFDTAKEDKAQYDNFSEIFWASGAALFISKDIFNKTGYFDPCYFLYMEEIDLMWRIHLLGSYRVVFVPAAKIYHSGDPHLNRENLWRMYYVHRNSFIMVLKNYSWITLILIAPIRFILEISIALAYFLLFKWKRTFAVLMAFGYILSHIPSILKRRLQVQAKRKIKDRHILARMYKGSIVISYVFGYKKASQLKLSKTFINGDQRPI